MKNYIVYYKDKDNNLYSIQAVGKNKIDVIISFARESNFKNCDIINVREVI